MNALSASIIFVIWAFLLSTIKQMLFPSDDNLSTTSEMAIQKVFHLTNSEIPAQSSTYRSLYEAYHRTEVMDAEKFTKQLKDRNLFNSSVLT